MLNPYAVVYVDDEALALKYFEKGFAQHFKIFTATNAAEGWAIIQQHHAEIGVLMSDQRMPGQTGVELLEKVRRAYPSIIRILVTAYTDLDSAIAGVNEGAIYRYVSKPWDAADLRINLLRALEFFSLLVERDRLLREKLSTLQQIVLSDRMKNLGVLAAGLSSSFRNALHAAGRFMAAIPPDLGGAPDFGQASIGKSLESSIKQSSHHIFEVATAMRDLVEEPLGSAGRPVSLPTLLASFAQSASGSPPVQLKIDTTLPAVPGNERQLLRLFTLLVSNLAAMAGDQARLHLEAEEIKTASGASAVRFVLSDDGPEWTADQRVRFFAPFSSTHDDASPQSG